MPPMRRTTRAHRSRTRATALLAIALAASLGLAGCQTGGDPKASSGQQKVDLPPLSTLTPVANPRTVEGPATAVIGGPSLPPLSAKAEAKLPVTVTSHDPGGDRRVEVKDTSRVIALSLTGTVAELVSAYGLTDRLVGRDVSTELPGTEDLPVVTKSGHTIDAESVLALNPTLILTDGSIGPTDVVLQLRDAGITVVTVTRSTDPKSTDVAAKEIAAALGVAPLGDELTAELDAAIAAKEEEIRPLVPKDPAKRPRVAFLYLRGTAGVFYLFGEGSGADSLIQGIGAVDVAKEIGWVGEKPMTSEALIASDPDVLLVMTGGLKSVKGVDGLLAAQPSIALTQAGKHRRIIDVDDTLVFAGGTRYPDVLDGLARAIYTDGSARS
ncbi:ABC transporter substrate-binding protein [Leucobacter iarius]|uniref:ABC transporter substrate-binding protein n=2 Tax=Leucobacter iarius TaxID=333963 RepID=A0ABP4Y2T9_9MICO